MSEMKIRDWRECSRRGSLIGLFSVELPTGMVIHDIQLHQHSQSRWVQMPKLETQDAAGDTRHLPVVSFASVRASQQFNDEALRALDDYLTSRPPAKQAVNQ